MVERSWGGRFEDRRHAGRELAQKLAAYADRSDVVVLGLPRGGVPVAAEVATRLHAPLDVLVVRKLGVPGSEECALGALASGGVVEVDAQLVRRLRVDAEALRRVVERERAELARRERLYRGDRPPVEVRGRTVLVVDDGLATGATMHAAVTALRSLAPKRVVVAVPVAGVDARDALASHADECVAVATPDPLFAVGLWYGDFEPTSDEEVVACLARAAARQSSTSGGQPAARPRRNAS